MRLRYLFLLVTYILWGSWTKANTYPEVVFDNSLIPNAYAKSHVLFTGGSWIENVNTHLPVSDTLYFTPGNALSLKYENAPSGNWEALIRYGRQKHHYQVKSSEILVFKLFVHSEHTQINELPKISLKQQDGSSRLISLNPYIDEYLTNTWLDIRIPISKITGFDLNNPIEGVVFHQNGLGSHHIFIDQIEFIPANYPTVRLSSPAVLSKIAAYDRHVHLQWQMPLTPSIRYVKIYRSEDNKLFEPVAIRPIGMEGGFDNIPLLNKTYYYKIAWVDYDYKESPFSAVMEVTPTKLPDEQLLNLIQLAHVNYFVENFDFNSGMHLPFHMRGDAIVSTKETGLALLSLIVGVERGFVSKNIFINRVKSIVEFLDKVPNKYGVFASFYDGRTQAPIYKNQKPHYSVQSSTTIMEALLVVRQYLSGDKEDEKQIRNQITKLWDRIDWPSLVLADTEDVLVADIGIFEELNDIRPLGGFNESMNTYILAAASTKSSISPSGFLNNIDFEYDPIQLIPDSVMIDSVYTDTDFTNDELLDILEDDIEDLDDSLSRKSLLKDTVLYGVRVPFGELNNRDLMQMYRPFLTIDPKTANTSKYQFAPILESYTKYVKRRDNNNGGRVTDVNIWGYHSEVDSMFNGRINPAISTSSISVDYEIGIDAMLALYHNFGNVLFTEYGFRSWLDIENYDVADEYQTINQATVAIMVENARSGLIWNLYNEIPEIKAVKEKIFVRNSLQ